ncbi:MAG: hypothetical protein MUF19_00010 [Candidatus Pacebacteria bacterium]|jgi:hypothetical protein|nr:hypothetical protein [Candidatus Paceibacterota bacterium]
MSKIILCTVLAFVGVYASTLVPVLAAEVSSSTAITSVTKLTPAEIEAKVRTYFADTPVMIEIARCESKFRQFTDAGNVFYGGADKGMVGVFQFYEIIHQSAALALGYDLATVEGNLGYAKHLYTLQGTTPWRSCVPATPVLDANIQERIALMKQLIGLLQQLLALKLAEG